MFLTVFVTYNNEGEETVSAIYYLVRFLKQNGVDVCLDSTNNKVRGRSISEWIDDRLEEVGIQNICYNNAEIGLTYQTDLFRMGAC